MSVDNSLFGQAVGKQIDNGSDMGTFTPADKPNAPMGVARGIHPGRVAWAHDPQAAVWMVNTDYIRMRIIIVRPVCVT